MLSGSLPGVRDYSFMRKPRWIAGFLLVALIAVLFVNLGFWQIRRLHWRQGLNAVITAQEHKPPIPLDQLAGKPLDEIQYRRVTATGTFDATEELILYGRPDATGQQGNHLLTPFTTESADTVIVDRGWVPLQLAHPPVTQATPPTDTTSITGVLLPPESTSHELPPQAGEVKDINFGQLSQVGASIDFPAYLMLQTQDPSQPGQYPVPGSLPQLSQGPHLSYAIQWFTFTIIGIVGFVVLVRKEAREQAQTPP